MTASADTTAVESPARCEGCGYLLPATGRTCPRCLARMLADDPSDGGGGRFDAAELAAMEAAARAIAGLEVLERLGHGGMGVVFRVRQTALDRVCALKMLPSALADDPRLSARFGREARALAALRHPGIVALYDHGVADGRPYLLMELVEGPTLAEVADGLPPEEAVGIAVALCRALAYAHARGVVHRDVKPANVLLDGRAPRLVDFGLAKLERGGDLTETRQVMGTPRYMAPEQWESPRDVDHRADLYAVGAVLYRLLTGRVPAGHFPAPGAGTALDAAVLRALSDRPSGRFADAGQMAEALEAAVTPPGWGVRVRQLVVAAGLLLALVLGPSAEVNGAAEDDPATRPHVSAMGVAWPPIPDEHVPKRNRNALRQLLLDQPADGSLEVDVVAHRGGRAVVAVRRWLSGRPWRMVFAVEPGQRVGRRVSAAELVNDAHNRRLHGDDPRYALLLRSRERSEWHQKLFDWRAPWVLIGRAADGSTLLEPLPLIRGFGGLDWGTGVLVLPWKAPRRPDALRGQVLGFDRLRRAVELGVEAGLTPELVGEDVWVLREGRQVGVLRIIDVDLVAGRATATVDWESSPVGFRPTEGDELASSSRGRGVPVLSVREDEVEVDVGAAKSAPRRFVVLRAGRYIGWLMAPAGRAGRSWLRLEHGASGERARVGDRAVEVQ